MSSLSSDPRKEGLKEGLRQLTVDQLLRVQSFPAKKLLLDELNYENGKFCPLAVGVGLDQFVKDPSQEKIYAILALAGYKINNTRGKSGTFYTTNRLSDLYLALYEVLEEKGYS